MAELQKEGKIKHLALTNFDTKHLKIITEAGVKIISNQVQFSVIDRRPQVAMIEYCQQNNIQLLAYGTLGGGLISERYLGQSEPKVFQLNTASLKKYKNMINAWGSWDLFQELLNVLQEIGTKHGVSIANVAVRYVLEQPAVAGAIVGARLSIAEHLEDNARVFELSLDEEDYQKIDAVSSKSQNLYKLIGDCGDEYRR
jgi:aryl-alcohol dehydrogenase-like predicted oxidoreductase